MPLLWQHDAGRPIGRVEMLAEDARGLRVIGQLVTASTSMRVTVTYQAGIATGWTGLPEPLPQGAVRLAAHLFAQRDAADEPAPPATIAALWRPWRRMRLA